jgi:nicotinate dehydrogenase subunit A
MSDPLSLSVNGAPRTVAVAPDTPLLLVLRNELALTGARYGCGLEQCGACMVLVDGEPAYSCTMQVQDAAGHQIETVEALTGADGTLHPLQQAFLDEQAGQCGYCLSGILVSAKALLDANPTPSRADIVEALDKHLCRCGTHTRILRAVATAAKAMEAGR